MSKWRISYGTLLTGHFLLSKKSYYYGVSLTVTVMIKCHKMTLSAQLSLPTIADCLQHNGLKRAVLAGPCHKFILMYCQWLFLCWDYHCFVGDRVLQAEQLTRTTILHTVCDKINTVFNYTNTP